MYEAYASSCLRCAYVLIGDGARVNGSGRDAPGVPKVWFCAAPDNAIAEITVAATAAAAAAVVADTLVGDGDDSIGRVGADDDTDDGDCCCCDDDDGGGGGGGAGDGGELDDGVCVEFMIDGFCGCETGGGYARAAWRCGSGADGTTPVTEWRGGPCPPPALEHTAYRRYRRTGRCEPTGSALTGANANMLWVGYSKNPSRTPERRESRPCRERSLRFITRALARQRSITGDRRRDPLWRIRQLSAVWLHHVRYAWWNGE